MKKIIKYLLTIILVIGLLFCVNNVRADSGWDYDYDSDWGSSWDSDYDSDWDSDYDSDWDDDYDSGSGSSFSDGEANYFTFVISGIIMIIITYAIINIAITNRKMYKIARNYSYKTYSSLFNDLPNEVVSITGMSLNHLKYLTADIYKKIQNAWSNFEYDTLRRLTTDELYNTYKMQLEALQLKNQKNIMTDIVILKIKIVNLKEENGILSVETYLNVSMYDYVVDSKDKVIRGTKKRKANIEYLITFVKTNKKSKETICPNCGAKVDLVSSKKCDYCGSTIVVDSKDFVMSKKKCINQRME